MKPMPGIPSRLLIAALALMAVACGGCEEKVRPYGAEARLRLPGTMQQVWAVAPAINLSGIRDVDPLLQADLVYQQLQQIDGLTVVPVNRVAEVFAGLKIQSVKSPEEAEEVCELLKCDALIVPTVTAYDPYDPPKLGASLQLFRRSKQAAGTEAGETDPAAFLQAVGMFDAANGSVRAALLAYAAGRNDPGSAMGPREYLESMDRYCGFVYDALAGDLLRQITKQPPA
jgi:hypothetical protein